MKGLSTAADVIAKLVAAGAVVFAAFIAKSYEQRVSGVTLVSQREQAESSLRASMFSNLIGPIAGPYNQGQEISANRERLLVELLALNFHESFEFKPLFDYVDRRLAEPPSGMDADEARTARRSLQSVARRVADRQLAQLVKDGGQWTLLTVTATPDAAESEHQRFARFGEVVTFIRSEKTCLVSFAVNHPDWEEQRVRIAGAVMDTLRDSDTSLDFTLTAFDLPYTDNTLLGDGSRFAIFLHSMRDSAEVDIKFVWFPDDFYGPRERPFNPAEFMKLLGLDSAKKSKRETED